jgi:hypothetical protein
MPGCFVRERIAKAASAAPRCFPVFRSPHQRLEVAATFEQSALESRKRLFYARLVERHSILTHSLHIHLPSNLGFTGSVDAAAPPLRKLPNDNLGSLRIDPQQNGVRGLIDSFRLIMPERERKLSRRQAVAVPCL